MIRPSGKLGPHDDDFREQLFGELRKLILEAIKQARATPHPHPLQQVKPASAKK